MQPQVLYRLSCTPLDYFRHILFKIKYYTINCLRYGDINVFGLDILIYNLYAV